MRLLRPLLWFLPALGLACSASEPTAPPSVILRVERGVDQSGEAGALLDPIVIAIVDLQGTPLPGVLVRIRNPAGGSVTLDNPRSGSDGTVTLRWRLAVLVGEQRLEIEADGARTLRLAAHALPPPPERLPLNQPLAIALPTYEGSGQAVHPDVAADPLLATRLLMAFTPYPFGDSRWENPSMATSLAPRQWLVPHGLTNPVATTDDGYFSDPDLVAPRDASDRWSLYYRAVIDGTNRILLVQSEDAVRWGSPVEVVRAPNHAVVSPAVVRDGAAPGWRMWSVNSGGAGCRAAQTTVEMRESDDGRRWRNSVATELAWEGRVVWHLDVIWVAERREYWALAATYPTGSSCVTDQLHFARSADGVRWIRHPEPVLAAGMLSEFSDIVYRSSLQLEPTHNSVVFWLSGARFDGARYTWRTGALRVTIDALLGATGLLVPSPFASTLDSRARLPMPERDY